MFALVVYNSLVLIVNNQFSFYSIYIFLFESYYLVEIDFEIVNFQKMCSSKVGKNFRSSCNIKHDEKSIIGKGDSNKGILFYICFGKTGGSTFKGVAFLFKLQLLSFETLCFHGWLKMNNNRGINRSVKRAEQLIDLTARLIKTRLVGYLSS